MNSEHWEHLRSTIMAINMTNTSSRSKIVLRYDRIKSNRKKRGGRDEQFLWEQSTNRIRVKKKRKLVGEALKAPCS